MLHFLKEQCRNGQQGNQHPEGNTDDAAVGCSCAGNRWNGRVLRREECSIDLNVSNNTIGVETSVGSSDKESQCGSSCSSNGDGSSQVDCEKSLDGSDLVDSDDGTEGQSDSNVDGCGGDGTR